MIRMVRHNIIELVKSRSKSIMINPICMERYRAFLQQKLMRLYQRHATSEITFWDAVLQISHVLADTNNSPLPLSNIGPT